MSQTSKVQIKSVTVEQVEHALDALHHVFRYPLVERSQTQSNAEPSSGDSSDDVVVKTPRPSSQCTSQRSGVGYSSGVEKNFDQLMTKKDRIRKRERRVAQQTERQLVALLEVLLHCFAAPRLEAGVIKAVRGSALHSFLHIQLKQFSSQSLVENMATYELVFALLSAIAWHRSLYRLLRFKFGKQQSLAGLVNGLENQAQLVLRFFKVKAKKLLDKLGVKDKQRPHKKRMSRKMRRDLKRGIKPTDPKKLVRQRSLSLNDMNTAGAIYRHCYSLPEESSESRWNDGRTVRRGDEDDSDTDQSDGKEGQELSTAPVEGKVSDEKSTDESVVKSSGSSSGDKPSAESHSTSDDSHEAVPPGKRACTACTYLFDIQHNTCPMCSTPQPQTSQQPSSLQTTSTEKSNRDGGSQPTSDGSEEEVPPGKRACTACTYLFDIQHDTCPMCSTPQPQISQQEVKSNVTLGACVLCTTINPPGARKCEVCQAVLGTPASQPVLVPGECAACTYLNPPDAEECDMCGSVLVINEMTGVSVLDQRRVIVSGVILRLSHTLQKRAKEWRTHRKQLAEARSRMQARKAALQQRISSIPLDGEKKMQMAPDEEQQPTGGSEQPREASEPSKSATDKQSGEKGKNRRTPRLERKVTEDDWKTAMQNLDGLSGKDYTRLLRNTRFDIVRKFERHDFEGSPGTKFKASKEYVNRLSAEFSDLAESLPIHESSSVFLRSNGQSISRAKLLIIGPLGTPYARGCFEFDVFFPPDYPKVSPKVNFRTTGNGQVRFNPNLYSNGKVCLSLLGTWRGGNKTESWTDESTILQLAVSIQSLILCELPYYNEPGYTSRPLDFAHEYNRRLYYDTVRWGIIDQLEHNTGCFADVIATHFYLTRRRVYQQALAWAKVNHRIEELLPKLRELLMELELPTTLVEESEESTGGYTDYYDDDDEKES